MADRLAQERSLDSERPLNTSWTDARSVFISDLHLGWSSSRPAQALDALERMRPDCLYLVGDTFEWLCGRSDFAHPDARRLLRRLHSLVYEGCEVFLLAGNHDHQLVEWRGRLPWPIVSHAMHSTVDGRRWLVLHGDVFDCSVTAGCDLVRDLGSRLYPALVKAGNLLQAVSPAPIREYRGARVSHWAMHWKMRSKRISEHVAAFERYMVELAIHHGCDGVICGHIHVPCIKQRESLAYINCGDWVENQSFLWESRDGRMELTHCDSSQAATRKVA